jgi:hypothetical protein
MEKHLENIKYHLILDIDGFITIGLWSKSSARTTLGAIFDHTSWFMSLLVDVESPKFKHLDCGKSLHLG